MKMSEKVVTINKGPKKTVMALVVLVILVIVAANAFFILEEGESALVQRFGEIRGVYVREASDTLRSQFAAETARLHIGTGLKFKVPFIDNVIKYPSKLIHYESPPTEVLTFDKHRLYFDNSAQWRIENPLRFYMRYTTIDRAKQRIDDALYSAMRVSVGRLDSYVLISDRESSSAMLAEMARTISEELVQEGISIVDIRIKRTDLPVETYESIYNRMNTERQMIAAQYRSEGEQALIQIRSATDREVIRITSEAQRDAEEIRGAADEEAAGIYNRAYNNDPEFFEFYNLLDTYRQTIGHGSTLVVPLDSPFAKYLLGVTPEAVPAVVVPPPSPEE
jgi:membrane protease subunit HflC